MRYEPLTFKSIRARPVVLTLKRPVVARIATITQWPLILIDLYTNEGVIGRRLRDVRRRAVARHGLSERRAEKHRRVGQSRAPHAHPP